MASIRLTILGDLGASTFRPWVDRHMRRLGLTGRVALQSASRMDLDLDGPEDLIDAMELGVSLGPIEAWVESIDRLPLNGPGGGTAASPDQSA